MPMLRISYIQKLYVTQEVIIYPDGSRHIDNNNYGCIRADWDINPGKISWLGPFNGVDISVTDYGEYNPVTGQSFGRCYMKYDGQDVQIVRISYKDYLHLRNNWENNLGNFQLDHPYYWSEDI